MGLALTYIKKGNSVIDTQLLSGYESSSGFRDAFSRIMGNAPTRLTACVLSATWIDTKLGPMLSIADEIGLYLLEFVDRRGLEKEIERLRKNLKAAIIPGKTSITEQIEQELTAYFNRACFTFKTPIHLVGTPFQKQVWEILKQIPPGTTLSYAQVAQEVKKPTAFRAVARANGTNQLALIIPCHRVINTSGELGGYAGGITRKQWLLNHEKQALLKTSS